MYLSIVLPRESHCAVFERDERLRTTGLDERDDHRDRTLPCLKPETDNWMAHAHTGD